ncbi:MAG: sugar nucleotide-binding protein, partial [Chloroflexota bacterium]
MQQRKIALITGGSSYLGQHLTARAGQAYSVHTTYHNHPDQIKAGHPLPLNLGSRAAVLRLIDMLAPEAIIHIAAINPGGSEREMMQINAEGTRYIAEGAVKVGARLVFVSTDVVHNGQQAPYDDDALPAPINLYGRSKAAAEAAIRELDPQAAIVRTSLIYGLEQMDRGTAGFVKRLQSGQPLVLFSDVIRQPVWVKTLNEALLKLVELDFAGTLNVAGRQAMSREEFGRRMLDWWQVDSRDLLKSGRAGDVSLTIPLDLRLTTAKAEQVLQMSLPGVVEVL